MSQFCLFTRVGKDALPSGKPPPWLPGEVQAGAEALDGSGAGGATVRPSARPKPTTARRARTTKAPTRRGHAPVPPRRR